MIHTEDNTPTPDHIIVGDNHHYGNNPVFDFSQSLLCTGGIETPIEQDIDELLKRIKDYSDKVKEYNRLVKDSVKKLKKAIKKQRKQQSND